MDIKVHPITPIAPARWNNQKHNDPPPKRKFKDDNTKNIFHSILKEKAGDAMPRDYNNEFNKLAFLEKTIILEDHRTNADPNNRVQKRVVRIDKNEPEYARTFLILKDLPEDNRFKNLFDADRNSIISHPNRDVSMTLLTPMYASYESYSSFLNQNPQNTMYQELTQDKPRLVCHTVKELQDKYFEKPDYIKFIDSRV